eukprot:SAG11_NODE_10073_length_858_cov_1.089592_1_plen_26_part_10
MASGYYYHDIIRIMIMRNGTFIIHNY